MAGARSRSPEKPSLVIGGVAVIAHGFARATVDIDAAVVAETQDVAQLISSAARHRLVPRIEDPGGFAEENLVLLLEHQPTGVPFDLSLARQAFEVEAAARPVMRSLQGIELRVPSLTTGAPFDQASVERTLAEFDALLEMDRQGDFRRLLDARTRVR